MHHISPQPPIYSHLSTTTQYYTDHYWCPHQSPSTLTHHHHYPRPPTSPTYHIKQFLGSHFTFATLPYAPTYHHFSDLPAYWVLGYIFRLLGASAWAATERAYYTGEIFHEYYVQEYSIASC